MSKKASVPNGPSKTGKPSGNGRGNNPPKTASKPSSAPKK
jgi:hypothetical protein